MSLKLLFRIILILTSLLLVVAGLPESELITTTEKPIAESRDSLEATDRLLKSVTEKDLDILLPAAKDLLKSASQNLESEKYPEAKLALDSVVFLISKTMNDSLMITYHELQYTYFLKTHQYDSAYKHLKAAHNKSYKRIELENKNKILKEEERLVLIGKKDQQIDTQKQQINQQIHIRLFLILLIISVIIVLGLILFLNYNVRKANLKILKQQTEITELTSDLDKLLVEKNSLLRELHHRVKNNLAVLAGIFDYQYKLTKGEEEKQLLAGINARIDSIALIHQQVYSYEVLSEIPAEPFLNELVVNLFDLHNPSLRIDHKVICDKKITTDDKLCFSLGIILNELLSISIKLTRPAEQALDCIIRFESEEFKLVLKYDDKNKNANFENIDQGEKSISLYLINTITEQFGGEFKWSGTNGFHAWISIPE